MSILIDELVRVYSPAGTPSYRKIENRQYIVKPSNFYGFSTILRRIRDSFRVLFGKSFAYHYYEDVK